MNIYELAQKYEQYAVQMRREFHANPELSNQEFETTRRIKEELRAFGIPYVTPAQTGVIAIIHGSAPGKTLGLRADIDALPIQELNDLPYASKNAGVMHACGHDAHTAALLTAARILQECKSSFSGTVKLIFQPAEEYFPSGALAMMKNGDLDDADGIMTLHVRNELPTGTIAAETGPVNSGSASIEIQVTGKGGHGGRPHQCVDALVAASSIVMNLQTIASRELNIANPAVLSIGVLQAGTAKNIIAETATMSGTMRYYNPEIVQQLGEAVTRIAQNTAAAYRASAKVDIVPGLPPIINDGHLAQVAKCAAECLWGEGAVVGFPRSTGVEDFAYYAQKAPIIQVGLGAGDGTPSTQYPRHNPRFNIDESAICRGAALYAQFAISYLGSSV